MCRCILNVKTLYMVYRDMTCTLPPSLISNDKLVSNTSIGTVFARALTVCRPVLFYSVLGTLLCRVLGRASPATCDVSGQKHGQPILGSALHLVSARMIAFCSSVRCPGTTLLFYVCGTALSVSACTYMHVQYMPMFHFCVI